MQSTNETVHTHDALFTQCTKRLNILFSHYLNELPESELKRAMEYALSNKGKQLRPLLVYAVGNMFNAALENLDVAAAAIELMHTYSLIHDDLPCMDNADLRRGKATSHKKFGEAIAVLTGDALQTLSFQILSSHPAKLSDEKRNQMISLLAHASGANGMASGQALDILHLQHEITKEFLENLYRLKTGALFSASIELGWLASEDNNKKNQLALKQFANLIGLAFQIQDDVLDIEAETNILGKPQGADHINQKQTYCELYGLQYAKQKVNELYQAAWLSIAHLGEKGNLLKEVVAFMLNRQQ